MVILSSSSVLTLAITALLCNRFLAYLIYDKDSKNISTIQQKDLNL